MFVIVLSWPLHAISSNEYILDLSKIYIKCKRLLRFSPQIFHFWHSALHIGGFCQFPSGGFTTMAVMNPLEKKLEKRTSVQLAATVGI